MAQTNTQKKQFETVKGVTPAGEAIFPKLVTPDTKFDNDGVYTVKLKLSEQEAQPLLNTIENLRQTSYDIAVENASNPVAKKKVKMAEPSYSKELDPETGEETGYYLFNFKLKAGGVSQRTGKPWSRKLPLFDTEGTPVTSFTNNDEIWGGSIIKVAYELRTYYVPSFGAGVSHTMQAVQLIEVHNGQAKTADDFGFDTVESGTFIASEKETTPFDTPDDGEQETTPTSRPVVNTPTASGGAHAGFDF